MDKMICKTCGKVFYQYPSRTRQGVRYCSRACAGIAERGEANPNYVRGYQLNSWGYKMVTHNGKKVYEHRLVMEQHLGRSLLPGEEVHHKDGNKLNNSIENLEILSMIEHKKKHRDKKTGKFISHIDEKGKEGVAVNG